MIKFPQDPIDGMLFESVPGVLYIYSAGQNAWIRLEGESARPATPTTSGLMSAEDLQKLNSIILPPPQTTISIEGQAAKLDSGTIDLYSSDRSVIITTTPVGMAGTAKTPLQWAIHENTAGIDIKLNLDKFIKDIEDLGKLKKVKMAGADGPQGAIGDDGQDYVATGPEGEPGLAGQNAPFLGNEASEVVQFDIDEEQSFRAVVDIETESVSVDENYIVLTRANIGNPGVCPTQVRPKAATSPWLLVIDESGTVTTRKVETSDGQLTCKICTSSLYYLNIDTIVATIKERFETKLAELKNAKESAVREWLSTMATVFSEQKYALCCALSNCQSRKRNDETRRFIEAQSIQAIQADHSLVIDSTNKNKVISRSKDDCALPPDPIGTDGRVKYGTECDAPLVKIRLDAKLHTSQPQDGAQRRWLTANLPAGDYILEVEDCCANLSKTPKAVEKPRSPKPTRPTPSPSTVRKPPYDVVTISGIVSIADINIPITEKVIQTIKDQAVEYQKCGGNNAPWLDPNSFGQRNRNFNDPAYASSYKMCNELSARHFAELMKVFDDEYARERGWVDDSADQRAESNNDKFTGVVSIQYVGVEPTVDDTTVTVKKTSTIPDFGMFNNLTAAKTTYIGSSTAFSHAGGEIAVWIEDPDGMPTNNDGEVVIGIRSRKCVEVITPTEPEPTDGSPITDMYIYRDVMSLDTLIGKIKVYDTDVTHHENYGYDGTGANVATGPDQTALVSKTFFVRGSDGFAFYIVNHKNDTALTSQIDATIKVESNHGALTYEADEPSEVTDVTTPEGTTYTAAWNQSGNSDGIFINGLDDNVGDNWQIELNASDFGAITKLTANGSDGNEFVLAQGANGEAISDNTDPNPFLLCRALRRSCNVPEGFGGRYSLGVINRKPITNFRLTRVLPEWTLNSFIQNEYTYAPQGNQCGCTQCDISFQKQVGEYNCDFLPNSNADKIDILYVVDVSPSMREYKESIPDFLDKLSLFLHSDNGYGKTQPSQLRFGLLVFGGRKESRSIRGPQAVDAKQGDPVFEQELIEYDPSNPSVITDIIREYDFREGGTAEPAMWATQWATTGANWDDDALKCIILISNEYSTTLDGEAVKSSHKGVNVSTAISAVENNNIIFNAITKKKVRRLNGNGFKNNPLWVDLNKIACASAFKYGLITQAEKDTNKNISFELEDTFNAPQSENISDWIYDQPLKNFRLGVNISPGAEQGAWRGTGYGLNYTFGGTPGYYTVNGLVRGPDTGFVGAIVQLKSSITGNQILATSITDTNGIYQFRIPSSFFPKSSTKSITFNVTVYLYSAQANDEWTIYNQNTSSIRKYRIYSSGGGFSPIGTDTIIWSTYDDPLSRTTDATPTTLRVGFGANQQAVPNPSLISDGFYPCAFQRIKNTNDNIPNIRVAKINNAKQIVSTIEFADDPISPNFTNFMIDVKHDTTACTLEIGPIKPVATATREWTVGAALATNNNSPYEYIEFIFDERSETIRNLTTAVEACRETFYQKFKRTIFTEFYLSTACSDEDKTTLYNGGPSTVLSHVNAIPMTQATLDGQVTSIVATIYALPNLSIRPLIFNDIGQGLLFKSHSMAQNSVWETHSWRIDEIDKVLIVTNPEGVVPDGVPIFKLTDLKYIAFEFVNPPTGLISFFGEVKVAVERETPLGRETIMVEISNFEPFKSSLKDPGEIPLVKWVGGTPTENDFSNYLECYWTITESGDSFNQTAFTQLREYCPECRVNEITTPTDTGSSTVQEIACNESAVVPLNKYIFSPQAPGDSCLMHYKQVIWYNRGWRINACCGARVDIDGTKWIVVKRSIGIDTTCGGGESESTQCINQFVERGEGHPAIAWPTIDGDEFAGIPLSGYARFVRDTSFSNQIKEKLVTGLVEEFRGNLTAANAADKIPFILFPASYD